MDMPNQELKPEIPSKSVATTETRPVGRPPGSVETPHALAIRDLKDTLKLQSELRDLIRRQMQQAETQLEDTGLDQRTKTIAVLVQALEMLNRSFQQTSKWVLPDNAPSGGADDTTKALEKLFGKKR